jgi:hypothetical protein
MAFTQLKSEEMTATEIPKCESCGRIAQYRCAVDEYYVCAECARYVPVSKMHIPTHGRPSVELKMVEKMGQDPIDGTAFESLGDMTGWPPPA